jgi:hypothetical protein
MIRSTIIRIKTGTDISDFNNELTNSSVKIAN